MLRIIFERKIKSIFFSKKSTLGTLEANSSILSEFWLRFNRHSYLRLAFKLKTSYFSMIDVRNDTTSCKSKTSPGTFNAIQDS